MTEQIYIKNNKPLIGLSKRMLPKLNRLLNESPKGNEIHLMFDDGTEFKAKQTKKILNVTFFES